MNSWIVIAGSLCLFTTFVHIFAGQVNPIRPFLASNLNDEIKATLLTVWHMVTAVLLLTSLLFIYAGLFQVSTLYSTVWAISILYIIFAMIFWVVGAYYFKARTFWMLPQWTIILPIGVLGLIGVW